MPKDGCINRLPAGRTPLERRPDEMLIGNNEHQADMSNAYNKKTGNAWLRQNGYAMSIRRELRRRGLPVAPIVGQKEWK